MSFSGRYGRKQLSYPLYGADFDPSNPDFLLVGGGGGSTSSGVPNKITLLDVSRNETINIITDIDLAKDEDSVTSLAVAESNEGSLTAYAGINSSLKDQEAKKNEHFRSFRIGLPARKRKADGSEKNSVSTVAEIQKTQALSRTALFKSATGPKSDTYQRVLRVAPAHKDGGERLAAIASGLGAQNEVLVFRATPSPSLSNVVSRINIESGEAADLDLVPVEDEVKSFALSYCTDYDVYLQHIPSASGGDLKEPKKVYSTPSAGRRHKIRCLRWLNSRHLLLLRNKPVGGGADLVIIKTDKDYTQTQEVLTKALTKTTKQAVGLATAALSASPKGEQQFLVAVAGQDSSIEILSIDWLPGSGMSKFRQYDYLRDVHSGPITKVTFSIFQPPELPVSKTTRPQYIRLATVGVDLNVTVFTLALSPYPAVYSKTPRYVLTPPSQAVQNAINITMAILVVAVTALCMQIFCELRGVVPPTLHARDWFPQSLSGGVLANPYSYYKHNAAPGPVIPESLPPILSEAVSSTVATATDMAESGATMLQDLVKEQILNPGSQIIMRGTADTSNPDSDTTSPDGAGNIEAVMHDKDSQTIQQDETIKTWDQLSEKEKRGWKKKLVDAGHWTEKQGESVLKGILFSQLGGIVADVIRG